MSARFDLTSNDAEAFDNQLAPKPPQTFRATLQNVNILPESSRHYKSRQLINRIREGGYDLWMMSEVGLYWGLLDPSDQWEERVQGLHNSTAIFAHNTTERSLSSKLQYGGVGMVATSDAKHRIIERGRDPSGMGCWVWM
jgi:hypothetical protein